MAGITTMQMNDLPIAIVDVETTGLHPAGDRIIEIAVVRKEPGAEARLVLDTLVNPRRRVTATEIHGITDGDVRDAPAFDDIAPVVAQALSGAVFASYNVYFDAKFVGAELTRAGTEAFPPHVCLMYMRPLLDLGRRCTLADACREHGVSHRNAHKAADDAIASAELWARYIIEMESLQLRTYGDLAKRKSYKFIKSFSAGLLDKPAPLTQVRLKSRSGLQEIVTSDEVLTPQERRAEYWDALKAALVDLQINEREGSYLAQKRRSLHLQEEEVRSLHARAFAGLLASAADDHVIDDAEVSRLALMAGALRELGWFPGDELVAAGGARDSGKGWLARWLGR